MEKEFIPFELAVKLKELGFDEKCLGYYIKNSSLWCNWLDVKFNDDPSNDKEDFVADAPLYQQAFRWFREKYKLHHVIHQFNFKKDTDKEYLAEVDKIEDGFEYFRTYEECEHFCLDKLIEIVKTKSE